METALQAVESAEQSYRRNLERIQNGQGLPLEALQSLQAAGGSAVVNTPQIPSRTSTSRSSRCSAALGGRVEAGVSAESSGGQHSG
jgi:hypothetical protein